MLGKVGIVFEPAFAADYLQLDAILCDAGDSTLAGYDEPVVDIELAFLIIFCFWSGKPSEPSMMHFIISMYCF